MGVGPDATPVSTDSNDPDPIREQHAQEARAEYALAVYLAMRRREITAGAGLVALRLAGVPEDSALLLCQASPPEDDENPPG